MRLPPPDLPDDLTPFERFREVARRVVSVTPEELTAREKAEREAREAQGKRRPGPKPKNGNGSE
jgi:hypothetical protein